MHRSRSVSRGSRRADGGPAAGASSPPEPIPSRNTTDLGAEPNRSRRRGRFPRCFTGGAGRFSRSRWLHSHCRWTGRAARVGEPDDRAAVEVGTGIREPGPAAPAKEDALPRIWEPGVEPLDDEGPRAGRDNPGRGPSHVRSRMPPAGRGGRSPRRSGPQTEARSTRRMSMTTVSGGAPSIMASASSAARAPSSHSGW